MKNIKYILLVGLVGLFFASPAALADFSEFYNNCLNEETETCEDAGGDYFDCRADSYDICDLYASDYDLCLAYPTDELTDCCLEYPEEEGCVTEEAGDEEDGGSLTEEDISDYGTCYTYYYLDCIDGDASRAETCSSTVDGLCCSYYPEATECAGEDAEEEVETSFSDYSECYTYYESYLGDETQATAVCDAIFSESSSEEEADSEEEGSSGGTGDDSTSGSGSGDVVRTTGTIPNPLGTATTIDSVFINIVQAILGVVGGLAFLVFVYNGFRFIFAAGNEETIGKAKKGMVWSLLGVVLILTAYTIVQYVFTSFGF